MRIDGWSIGAFGPIDQWGESGLAHHDVVVVLGPNESGKSALFEFFASALFRLLAGHSRRASLSSVGRSLFGRPTRRRVERWRADPHRPSAHLTTRRPNHSAEGEERLAIGPFPYVGLMTRDVFKNVYALDPGRSAWPRKAGLAARPGSGARRQFLRLSTTVARGSERARHRTPASLAAGPPRQA